MNLVESLPLNSNKYSALIAGTSTPDIGVITGTERVSQLDRGLNEAGLDSTEFDDVRNRYVFTVGIELLSRQGELTNVPYLFVASSTAAFDGSIPVRGQNALIVYVGNQRSPIAIGGYRTWRTMRRLIADGVFPELKPGEFFQQSAIRENPMSFFEENAGEVADVEGILEKIPGARIYGDYKGRLVLESHHYRSNNEDGAFVKITLGNPADTVADDEASDFNVQDESNDKFVALEATVAASPGSASLFKFVVANDGTVAFEFPKGYFGRAAGSGAEPDTTVEVNVDDDEVILDANVIKHGRAAEESAVLGDTLVSMMGELVDAILSITQATAGPGGPTTGPPFNASTFFDLKIRLSEMLSETNKVE